MSTFRIYLRAAKRLRYLTRRMIELHELKKSEPYGSPYHAAYDAAHDLYNDHLTIYGHTFGHVTTHRLRAIATDTK